MSAAIVFLVAPLVIGRRVMISKIWPATFFDVQTGKATKDMNANPPKIVIIIPVRLKCRVEPGVDHLSIRAFDRMESPSGTLISRYMEGFSFSMPKGKSPAFELRVVIEKLDRRTVENWNGGQVEIVMEHGWRRGKRAIRTPVEVEVEK